MKAGRHRISSKTFSRQEWKAVKKNQDPRYQYLGAIPGLPTKMVVDFKDFFMVPCELIYREIENGSVTRAVEMNSPYKEHVLQRFAWYLMRVGLPKDFDQLIEVARIISEPSTAQQQPAVNADFTAPIVTAPEVATQPQSDGSTTTPTGKEPEPSTE
ncbi:MAG: hypothetical protein JXR96_18205 [Deltaproteobacteria bacterium]|nr:hypothetical protein [Deltaproteobacteria bacterium]